MIGRIFTRVTFRSFLFSLAILCGISLIWYHAPRFAVDGRSPFATPNARAMLVVALFLLWLLYAGIRWLLRRLPRLRIVMQPAEAPARPQSERAAADAQAQAAALERQVIARQCAQLEHSFRAALQVVHRGGPAWRFGRHSAYRLPWYLMLGEEASGKTALLHASGLKLSHDDAVAAVQQTDSQCQWWFADEAVLFEPSGHVGLSPERGAVEQAVWSDALRRLRRARPRCPINGVLLTLRVSELLQRNETERAASAMRVRERLTDMQLALGSAFPIYVVVTHCDHLAGFHEFFEALGREQRTQVWGMTFPLVQADQVNTALASFPEEFDALVQRLQSHVVERVRAQFDPNRCAAIYGFPLQFDALREPIARFLDDAFRASPYAPNALLRGVYFTSAAQDGQVQARSASPLAQQLRRAALPVLAARGDGPGYFITQLLRSVVFREAGLASARLQLPRQRALQQRGVAVAVALCALALVAGMLVSYGRNQQLIAAASRAGEDVRTLAQHGVMRDQPQTMLPLLDAARDVPAGYAERNLEVPLLSRFGLYQGDRLGKAAQAQYQALLRRSVQPFLLQRLSDALHDGQRSLSDQYRALRVYLMLGDKSHYDAAAVLDWFEKDTRGLALTERQRQDFLAHARTLFDAATFDAKVPLDTGLIASTRAVLNNHPLAERLFEGVRAQFEAEMPPALSVAQMAGINAPLVLRRKSGQPLSEGVPGAYTLAGYPAYSALRDMAVAHVNQDHWVLDKDESAGIAGVPASLKTALDRLYFGQYIAAWEGLLNDIELLPLPKSEDSASLVRLLAGADSPLRLFLQAAATQTTLHVRTTGAGSARAEAPAVGWFGKFKQFITSPFQSKPEPQKAVAAAPLDVAAANPVDRHFEALHQLVSGPGGNAPLDQVQASLAEMAVYLDAVTAARERGLPPPPPAALDKLKRAAEAQPAPLGGILKGLSSSGLTLTLRGERERLNGLWQTDVAQFCHQALTARYPFDRQAQVDVTQTDFIRLLGPGGLIDTFFQANLQPYVDMTTMPWQWRANAALLRMSPAVLRTFQNAALIRHAFFLDGSKALSIRFDLMPVAMDAALTRFSLNLDGQTLDYAHGPSRPVTFQWPRAEGGYMARVDYEPSGADGRSGFSTSGPWALFRLLDKGRLTTVRSDLFNLTFNLDGRDVTFEMNASSVLNPFALTALRQFRCLDRL